LSSGSNVLALGLKAALIEIYRFAATRTPMGPLEFVGEDFLLFAALRAFAYK